MYSYRAFGLLIGSELKLAELTVDPSGAAPDLLIRRAPLLPPGELTDDEAQLRVEGGRVVMTYPGVAAFWLSPEEGSVSVAPERGAEHLVSLPLLGPVMAVYLHLGGRLVLHASAVRRAGRAVAFVGDKGAGKSTTAAACVKTGAGLLTDDLLVCLLTDGPIRCEPTFSQLKLNADAARALPLEAGEAVASPHPLFSKHIIRLPDVPPDSPPLTALCELVRGEHLALQRLSASEALGVVLRFSYVGRYGPTFLSGAQGALHFRRGADMAARVAVWRLQAPGSIEELEREASEILTMVLGGEVE